MSPPCRPDHAGSWKSTTQQRTDGRATGYTKCQHVKPTGEHGTHAGCKNVQQTDSKASSDTSRKGTFVGEQNNADAIREEDTGGSDHVVGLSETETGIVFEHLDEQETEFLYEEIFVRCSYLHGSVTMPDKGDIVDVGANIGLFSLWCLEHNADVRVVAFEPARSCANVLRRNLRRYGDRAQIRQLALADVFGESVLVYYPSAPGESTRWPLENEEQQRILSNCCENAVRDAMRDAVRESCTLSTLEQECPGPIAWLKIDAEGDELRILNHAGDFGRIKQISLEVRDVDGRLAAVVKLLQEQNFKVAREKK
eukprot:GEMP01053737.1.p1 GENE.GEMP01053737.1~~GEMP01053737.1.p1  ORF type:complete len:311 (+),score=68.25 GEMP01053737.1:52-984(+)